MSTTGSSSGSVELEPVPCEHCGAMLKVYGFAMGEKVYNFRSIEQCHCEQAVAERAMRDAETRAEIEEDSKRKFREAQDLACIGERYRDATFDTFEIVDDASARVLKACQNYCAKFRSEYLPKGVGIYITGGYGVGKTHVAACVANELLSQGHSVRFAKSLELLGEIKGSYSKNAYKDESALVERFAAPDLLVIDDLGKEPFTEWALSMLHRIFDKRDEKLRPIIVTSNYTLDDILGELSDAKGRDAVRSIIDRLNGCTRALEYPGKSRRCE